MWSPWQQDWSLVLPPSTGTFEPSDQLSEREEPVVRERVRWAVPFEDTWW